MAIVCPITNNRRPFPLHIRLDERTKTTGVVECEQIKSLDIKARKYRFIERAPKEILDAALEAVFSEIEIFSAD